MVVCAVICEPVSEAKSPITAKNTGKNERLGINQRRESQKLHSHRRFWSKTTANLTGKKYSITGKLPKITGKNIHFANLGPSHVQIHNRPSACRNSHHLRPSQPPEFCAAFAKWKAIGRWFSADFGSVPWHP